MSSPLNFNHLPRISLSKLYESSVTNKSSSLSITQIHGKAHHEDIIVQSPFYERKENCKGPCTCAYHRMKRYKQLGNILRFQVSNKMKDQLSEYKSRIAAAVRASNSSTKQNICQVQKPRKPRRTEAINICNFEDKGRKAKRRLNLDNYNYLFEQILKKRLQPMQDHQKVANLMKFIKIYSNLNPNYLKKIKDYINLNLLKVVQKIPFDKLLQLREDDEEAIKKIGIIINGKRELAVEFLRGIKSSMKDMEFFLLQRSKQKLQENLENQSQNLSHSRQFRQYSKSKHNKSQNEDNFQNIFNNIDEDQQKFNEEVERFKNGSRLSPFKANDQNVINEQKFLTLAPLSPKKRGTIPIKKSNIFHHENNGENTNNIKSINRSTYKDSVDNKQLEKKKKTSSTGLQLQSVQRQNTQRKKHKNHNVSLLLLMKKKSSRKLEQQEQKTQQIVVDNQTIKIKIKGSSHGKRRVVSKIKQSPNPFNSIQYSSLITKEQFQKVVNLLGDKNTLPVNEQMQKLFSLIQRRISGNPQFFQQFLKIFQKVINPEQIKVLREKQTNNQYKKMIQKLTKQVDNCLYELKQSTDKRYLQEEQQYRRQSPILKNAMNLECISNNQTLFDEFNKFKIVEKSPPPVIPVEEELLQQKSYGDLFLEQIIDMPELKMLYLKEKSMKDTNKIKQQEFCDGKINEQKHRQILRYMRRNHPLAFNSVKQNIQDTLQNNIDKSD